MSADFPDLLTVDIKDFDYGTDENFSNVGLKFVDTFQQIDRSPSQFQSEPTSFDEAALMDQLRAEKSVRGTQIPPILCDYYDRCSEYFYKSFLDLLTNYLSNVKALKKLTEMNANSKQMKFFELNLASKLNFGSHPTLQECALKCDAAMKIS